MQARRLSFNHGWQWLRQGFQLWRRNPAFLTFVSFSYLLALLLVSGIPLLGQAVASLLMPALSLGVLTAFRAVDERQALKPSVLLHGFRHQLRDLLIVGALYWGGSLLIMLLVFAVDGGYLAGVLAGTQPFNGNDDQLFRSFLWMVALSTPLIMAYWFAPALTGWWKVPAIKSMFFSFVACARNWRAFSAFSIALLVLGGLVPSLIIGALGAVAPILATLMMLLLPLVLVPVLFGSFYTSTRQVFQPLGQEVDEHVE